MALYTEGVTTLSWLS